MPAGFFHLASNDVTQLFSFEPQQGAPKLKSVKNEKGEKERGLDLLVLFSYPRKKGLNVQKVISLIRATITPDRFPYLTLFSNIFLGFAFGRIIVTPAGELTESILIKVFLIIGTCLFFNYLLCIRKATKGITRSPAGKVRPLLRELCLCAALNGFMFLSSLSFFFFKSLYL